MIFENYIKSRFWCPLIKFYWNIANTHVLMLQWQSWVVITESIWAVKPKIFILWSFPENICWPLIWHIEWILTLNGNGWTCLPIPSESTPHTDTLHECDHKITLQMGSQMCQMPSSWHGSKISRDCKHFKMPFLLF